MKRDQQIGQMRLMNIFQRFGFNWVPYVTTGKFTDYGYIETLRVGNIVFHFRTNPEHTYTYLTRYEVNTLIAALRNFK